MTKRKPKRYAKRVGKDDFVVGHEAVYVPAGDAPVVPGKIVYATPATVRFEVSSFLAALGLSRRTTWTYRNKAGGWFQKGTRPKKGETGLCLLQRR